MMIGKSITVNGATAPSTSGLPKDGRPTQSGKFKSGHYRPHGRQPYCCHNVLVWLPIRAIWITGFLLPIRRLTARGGCNPGGQTPADSLQMQARVKIYSPAGCIGAGPQRDRAAMIADTSGFMK